MASVEAAVRRRAYSVTPPPTPATVVIARPLIHVHAAITNDAAAIVIAISAIASRYAAADNGQ